MPTATAILPSNGTVALNDAAAASSASGGNAFREVLRTVNTAAADQTADASVTPAPAQAVPSAGNSSPAVQDTAIGPSVPATNADDEAMAAEGPAGAPFLAANGRVPVAVRAVAPLSGAAAKVSRVARPAPAADPGTPAATPPAAGVIEVAREQPVASTEPVCTGSNGQAIAQPAAASVESTAMDAGGQPSRSEAPIAALPLPLPVGKATPSRDQPDAVSPADAARKAALPGTDATPTAKPETVPAIGNQPLPSGAGPAASVPPTAAADRPDAVSAATAVQKKAREPADRPVASAGAEALTQPPISTTPVIELPAVATPASPANASAAAAGAPAASTATGPASPAAQIAPAFLTLGQAADGSRQMTLRLHPAELGSVQVQIGRSETGTARVDITVEKAGTLQALLRDQPDLHRALDEAGIPAAGRTIVFHAAPASPAAGGNGSASPGASQGGSGNTGGNSTPSGGGRSGYAGSEQSGAHGRSPTGKNSPASTASYRVGLDIVA